MFGLLISPVAIPLSALITGLIVVTSSTRIERHEKIEQSTKFACNAPASHVPVELALPSGASVSRITDDKGELAFEIPDTEPYSGTVTSRASGAIQQVRYARPMPAMSELRDAVMSCASMTKLAGPLKLKLTTDTGGAPVHLAFDAPYDVGQGSRFATCVTVAITKVRFPAAQRGKTLVLPFQLPT